MTTTPEQTSAGRRPSEGSMLGKANGLARRPWFLVPILVLVTFLVYRPSWNAGFIWDDDDHLTANPVMTSAGGLKMIWSSVTYARYYPLTLTTFWLESGIWAFEAMPYHLVNIALQAINGILVFLILRRLRVPGAWVAACLWAVHPVNVESAAWITELKNLQSGLFFFLSVLCFLRFDAGGERRWYTLALVCGVAAMLSKSSTAVLPLVLLLCMWWEHGAWRRRDLLRSVPFFLLACGVSVLAIAEQHGQVARAGTDEWKLGMAERFIIAGKAIWFYAGKTLWPVDLMFVYPRWDVRAGSITEWAPLAAVVATGLVLWKLRGRSWGRGALFGVGFFVVGLLPVLGFFDVYYFRYSYVADHFQYLASLGVIVPVVAAIASVLRRPSGRLLTGVVAIAALAALSWRHGWVFRNEEALWRDVVARNPKCVLAHVNLAEELVEQGRLTEALDQCQEALRLKPNEASAHDTWVSILVRTGQAREAGERDARSGNQAR